MHGKKTKEKNVLKKRERKKKWSRISNFKQSQLESMVMQESIKVCTMTIKNKVDL